MSKIVCIVEGHGEVEAVPVLINRIAREQDTPLYPEALRPIRVSATAFLKENEMERTLRLAALKLGGSGAIFILLDCDDGCPARLGSELLARARASRPDHPIALVLARGLEQGLSEILWNPFLNGLNLVGEDAKNYG